MDRDNRPRGREKHVTQSSQQVHRRGDGLDLGQGPLGEQSGYEGRHSESGSEKSGLGNTNRRVSGRGNPLEQVVENIALNQLEKAVRTPGGLKKLLPLILIVVVIFIGVSIFGGGGSLLSMLGMGESTGINPDHSLANTYDYVGEQGTSTYQNNTSGGNNNTGALNTSVSAQARDKYTKIMGNGSDDVTLMIYMCGTDLESRGGAATKDLQEMLAAQIGANVNIIVETGGAEKWQNNIVSNEVNQIYKVTSEGLVLLEDDLGSKSMTDPNTLTEFIRYCEGNFPANRYDLIFWDHGGGTISGYGYDMKFPNSGSMTLDKINSALKNAEVTFDFIGFDACLMATLETALMLEPYADYLIASEETEPGSGWYYTDWLTALSEDTSMSTIEIGKLIVDTFIQTSTQGQTTLSVIDLAEVAGTVPKVFTDFAKSTANLLEKGDYQNVSHARGNVREFAKSSGIDQVDLIHLAESINTTESNALAKVLRSCVKYNLTGRGMENSYGISIYFPYQKPSSLSPILNTYDKIGIDKEYSDCIKRFANMEIGGQISAGGTSSSMGSLFGTLLGGGSSVSSSQSSSVNIGDLLGSFLQGGDFSGLSGFTLDTQTDWVDGRMIQDAATMYETGKLDTSALTYEDKEGSKVLQLTEEQWNQIANVELNVFLDDGTGYIDLGLDNAISFDEEGDLIADYDKTWLAINGQVVSYYMVSEVDEGDSYTILGRVPAMLNGQLVDLILEFTEENPEGRVLGGQIDYDGLTDTQAKGLIEIKDGDELDFLCDYYSYDEEFINNYYLGEQLVVEGTLNISNVSVGNLDYKASYRFTDIYHNYYWTPEILE